MDTYLLRLGLGSAWPDAAERWCSEGLVHQATLVTLISTQRGAKPALEWDGKYLLVGLQGQGQKGIVRLTETLRPA